MYPGDVVDALVEMHSDGSLRRDGVVSPADVPIGVLRLFNHAHAERIGDFLNHWVVCD